MKKSPALSTLLLVQRELRQFYANDKDSQALLELATLIKGYKEPKVLITVEGGIVQSVMSTNDNMKVVITDYDHKGDDPVIVSDPEKPQKLTGVENFYELFTDVKDPVEMEVRDCLKRHKF